MIAVVTEVSRFYFEVVRELKKRNQDFLSLMLDQKIPSYVDVIITTGEERERIDFENVVSGGDIPFLVDEAIGALRGTKTSFEKLIIGIDPGVKPGLVALGDKSVIFIQHLGSPEEVSSVLKDVLKRYDAEEILVKVGSGGGAYRSRILKGLQENFDLPIEVVDEISTTPSVGKTYQRSKIKDIIAAINIALKDGRLLKSGVEILPKKGEIKNIQRESRILSENITISEELAERVLKGELTIEEALKNQKEKKVR